MLCTHYTFVQVIAWTDLPVQVITCTTDMNRPRLYTNVLSCRSYNLFGSNIPIKL